jgi:hypothetical protein
MKKWLLQGGGLLLLSVLLMFLRGSLLFLEPRFWAEEGSVYFAHAYRTSFLQNLVTDFFGYYTLVPNLATALATLVPLERAPLVTTCLALVVQLLVCSVVIFGRCLCWNSVPKKLVIVGAVLTLSSGDVWLNTINSMYWLAIGTFFILLEDSEEQSAPGVMFQRGMLVLAGLSGVVSCFMTPVFMLKAYRSRRREEWIQTGILVSTSLLQLAVLVSSYRAANPLLGERFTGSGFQWQKILGMHFFLPFFDPEWLQRDGVLNFDLRFLEFSTALAGEDNPLWSRVSVLLTVGLMILLLVTLFMKLRKEPMAQEIVASFLLVSILSTVSSLRMASAPRYLFAPGIMLLTLLLYAACREGLPAWWGRTVLLLLGIAILGNGIAYRSKLERYANPAWPKWRDELRLWRGNSSYEPRIWPLAKEWVVKLESR